MEVPLQKQLNYWRSKANAAIRKEHGPSQSVSRDRFELVGDRIDVLERGLAEDPGNEELSMYDTIVPSENVETRSAYAVLHRAVKGLTPRTRKIVISYYGLNEEEPRTFDEIGQELGLTPNRVRYMRNRGTEELRKNEELRAAFPDRVAARESNLQKRREEISRNYRSA